MAGQIDIDGRDMDRLGRYGWTRRYTRMGLVDMDGRIGRQIWMDE